MSQHHKRLSGSALQKRNAKLLAISDICHLCGQPGSDAIDHVIPFKRCITLGLDPETPSNLKPAHHDVAPYCNRRKSDALPSEYDRRVVLVCGPPGAGKTTHAQHLAKAEGLEVYDLDDARWHGSDAIFRAELVRLREQQRARAVVIRSGASLSARQKAATMAGATDCVVLDTDLATCVTRIKERGRLEPPLRIQINGARKWWTDYEAGPVRLSFATLRLKRSGSLA